MFLPGRNFTGNLVVISHQSLNSFRLRIVVLVDVVREHPVGCEVAGNHCDCVLYVLNPV